jgi:hypothetical protein
MVKSPIEIIIELLIGIVARAAEDLSFILRKLFEFFQSIVIHSGGTFLSLVISSLVTLSIMILIRKEIFSSIKSIIIFLLVFVGFMLLLLFTFYIFQSIQ